MCLHEQPTVRRHARLRRGPVLLRARGTDGQARGRARHRPDRAATAERARARGLVADRTEDHRDTSRRGSDSPRSCARGPRGRGATAQSHASSRRLGQHHARRRSPPWRGLRRRLQEHRLLGGLRRLHRGESAATCRRQRDRPLRGRRSRAGSRERHPAGRAHRARYPRCRGCATYDRDGRLCRLGFRFAHDLDGFGRCAGRVPGRAGRAREERERSRSTSSGSTVIPARRPSIPRRVRSPASGRTSRTRAPPCALSPRSTSSWA